MKDKRTKTIIILISAIIATASLTSCKSTASGESQTDASGQADTQSAIESTRDEYYEAVIKDLEDQLLGAKEDNYITSTEYKLQLQELRDSIAALEKKLEPKPDVPQSDSQHNTIYNEENNSQTDDLSVRPPFTYTEQNGYLTITAHNTSDSEIVIPSHIGGVAVNMIGEGAFKQSAARKIVVSDGITTIDWFAFSNSSNLCEVTIPPSVTSIGYGAFDGCRADLVIKCKKGSYAESYAKSWGFIVVCE